MFGWQRYDDESPYDKYVPDSKKKPEKKAAAKKPAKKAKKK